MDSLCFLPKNALTTKTDDDMSTLNVISDLQSYSELIEG